MAYVLVQIKRAYKGGFLGAEGARRKAPGCSCTEQLAKYDEVALGAEPRGCRVPLEVSAAPCHCSARERPRPRRRLFLSVFIGIEYIRTAVL